MPKILAGKYHLIRTLGKGASCKVKLAFPLNNESDHVAIKIISCDEKYEELFINEVSAMDVLKHENIINYIEHGTGDIVHLEDKNVKNVVRVKYIVLELAQEGGLYDVIAHTGSFEESMARYFFIQFMNGLEYCHNQGIVHRDLTLKNLLFDKFYNIKIADFGLNGPLYLLINNGNLDTKLGTPSYMAPEILLN